MSHHVFYVVCEDGADGAELGSEIFSYTVYSEIVPYALFSDSSSKICLVVESAQQSMYCTRSYWANISYARLRGNTCRNGATTT